MGRWGLSAVLALTLSTSWAGAHEFWISPESYQLDPGASLEARLRVGEKLKGPSYVYNPARITRFELVQGSAVTSVQGRMGDDPALSMHLVQDGLWIVVHETQTSTLTYRDAKKFAKFVEHKALTGTLEAHVSRGLPETGFREGYRRYAKALIAVGEGDGADTVTGLRTEIVALANPYTDDLSNGLTVRVLLDGSPRVGERVSLFARFADGTVTETYHLTDAQGEVTLPMVPDTEYLVDSVTMESTDNDDPEAGPVWQSLWAALTFRTPPSD